MDDIGGDMKTQSVIQNRWTKNILIKLPMVLVFVFVLVFSAFSNGNASGIPLIYIGTVQKDVSVVISGVNFPAGQDFTVRMAVS
jgi:hypothetical protein